MRVVVDQEVYACVKQIRAPDIHITKTRRWRNRTREEKYPNSEVTIAFNQVVDKILEVEQTKTAVA